MNGLISKTSNVVRACVVINIHFRMCLRGLFSIDSRCQQESPWISSQQVAQDRELKINTCTESSVPMANYTYVCESIYKRLPWTCTNYVTQVNLSLFTRSSHALTESWGVFALVFWLRKTLPLTWWSHYKSTLQITVTLHSKYNQEPINREKEHLTTVVA